MPRVTMLCARTEMIGFSMNKPKTMRRVYQVAALVIFILGALLLRGSLDLHYYTSMGPGPGFFPFWLSLILAMLAALMFFEATFTKLPDEAPSDLFPDRAGLLRIAAIPVALGSVALLLERIGFGPAMFLMNMFVMLVLTKRHLLIVLIIAFVGSFGVEYLFAHWLNVQLPATNLGALCPQSWCGE